MRLETPKTGTSHAVLLRLLLGSTADKVEAVPQTLRGDVGRAISPCHIAGMVARAISPRLSTSRGTARATLAELEPACGDGVGDDRPGPVVPVEDVRATAKSPPSNRCGT